MENDKKDLIDETKNNAAENGGIETPKNDGIEASKTAETGASEVDASDSTLVENDEKKEKNTATKKTGNSLSDSFKEFGRTVKAGFIGMFGKVDGETPAKKKRRIINTAVVGVLVLAIIASVVIPVAITAANKDKYELYVVPSSTNTVADGSFTVYANGKEVKNIGKIKAGTELTLKAQANEHYIVVSWYEYRWTLAEWLDKKSLSGEDLIPLKTNDDIATYRMGKRDTILVLEFKHVDYSLRTVATLESENNNQSATTVGGNISVKIGNGNFSSSITGTRDYDVERGTTVTFRADISLGYKFDGWYRNGKKLSAENAETYTIIDERTIENAETYTIIDERTMTMKMTAGGELIEARFYRSLDGTGTIANTTEITKGSGTKADPYLIGSKEQFAYFADKINADGRYGIAATQEYFKLTSDINLCDAQWTPIGGFAAGREFKGFFDGNGYTISRFAVTDTSAQQSDGLGKHYIQAGLFGQARGARIENLVVKGAIVRLTAAAFSGGTEVIVCAGGLIGSGLSIDIRNTVVYSDISVTGISGTVMAGLVAGELDSAYASEDYKSIESISAVGALNISNVLSVYAGGFAGVIKNYQARHQAETPDVAQIDDITIVANEFKVENVTRAIVGGLVGEASASAFNNVKVGVVQVGAIKVSASVFAYVGGLIGVLSDANSSDVYLKNANAFGLSLDVSAVDFLKGGLIGRLLGTSDNVILGDCKNASGETNQIGNKLVD